MLDQVDLRPAASNHLRHGNDGLLLDLQKVKNLVMLGLHFVLQYFERTFHEESFPLRVAETFQICLARVGHPLDLLE